MVDEDNMEITAEELVENNNIILNALIDMLIEKKIISEDELKEKLATIEKELSSNDEGCVCCSDKSADEECECSDSESEDSECEDDCCCGCGDEKEEQ